MLEKVDCAWDPEAIMRSLRWVVLRIDLAQAPFIIKNEGKRLTSTYRLVY
jgi:hypothetical protein